MAENTEPLFVESNGVEALGIQIPGAPPNRLDAQPFNVDLARGIVASIIHIKLGVTIPAHFHNGGSEADFVLAGDPIDAGRSCSPGAFLTHAAGVVHGPHSSENGCRVLTIRSADLDADDHHIVQETPSEGRSTIQADPSRAKGEAEAEVPAGEKSAAMPDNPTTPTTG